jgi:D-alanine-D-alanine ligase
MSDLPACVLVLHNRPRPDARYSEADAGVMDQVRAVAEALAQLGVRPSVAGVSSLAQAAQVLAGSVEPVVFNLVESLDCPEDAALVPALCRSHAKACTGNTTACLMLTTDKWQTRASLQAAGLTVPPGALVGVGRRVRPTQLGAGPFIVKPVATDGSEGITAASVVKGPGAAMNRLVAQIHEHLRQPALIERFVGQRELDIALVQKGRHAHVLAVAEIDFSAFGPDQPRVVDYQAKWVSGSFGFANTPGIIPAPLGKRLTQRVSDAAVAAWDAAGCQDYARVDMRLDGEQPVILEVNANPDISPDAGFSAALAAAKVGFAEFVGLMLANAMARLGAPAPASRKSMAAPACDIRTSLPADRQTVMGLLGGTGKFRPGELDIAAEVLDEANAKGPGGHYQSFVAEMDGRVCGWVCYGPTPCTQGTWDVYWLGVDAAIQGKGVGQALMHHAERAIHAAGGRLAVVETSGRDDYDQARRFYTRFGYRQASRLRDFYAPGDDKVVYLKPLQ